MLVSECYVPPCTFFLGGSGGEARADMQGRRFCERLLSKYYFYGQIFIDSRIRVKHLLFD
jgi:hypothetical protein